MNLRLGISPAPLLSLGLVLAPLACFVANEDGDTLADDESSTDGGSDPGDSSGDSSGDGDGDGDDSTTTASTSTSSGPDTTADSDSSSDDMPDSGMETSNSACGNGVIEDGETCDSQDLGGVSCASIGHASGEVGCDAQCMLDVDDCHTCGDQQLDGIEACDSSNLAGQTCGDLGFQSGALACSADCLVFDTAGCVPFPHCNNGQIEPMLGEQCEAGNLAGASCASLGFTKGTLACTAGCQFDTSDCTLCGNADLEPGEQCDVFDFGGTTCQAYGFADGWLNCTEQCTIDTDECCPGECP
ncbi:hypothetical protein ACNOYE_39580 [Nannocystaceae bacterium ST9]